MIRKRIKMILTLVLSIAVTAGGCPQAYTAYADEMAAEAEVSADGMAENAVSEEAISGNTISAGALPENEPEEFAEEASENGAAENEVSENTVSENMASEKTVSENTVSESIENTQAAVVKNVNLNTGSSIAGIDNPDTANENSAWSGSRVFLGRKECLVLDKDGSMDMYSSVPGDMLLLTKDVLSVTQPLDTNDNGDWSTCTLRTNLNNSDLDEADGGFISRFTNPELRSIDPTAISKSNTSHGGEHTSNYPTATTNDRVFCLDTEDMFMRTSYGFKGDASRITGSTYCLRSIGYYSNGADYVKEDGSRDESHANDSHGVRPAFNLRLSSILFATVSGADASQSFAVTSDTAAETWKLTLAGGSGFAARLAAGSSDTVYSGEDIAVNVSAIGSPSANVAYTQLTAMLVDGSGFVQAFGKVKDQAAADSSLKVSIPSAASEGDYTLKVFAEQVNGGINTDYASNMADIPVRVSSKLRPEITLTAPAEVEYSMAKASDISVKAVLNVSSAAVTTQLFCIGTDAASAQAVNTFDNAADYDSLAAAGIKLSDITALAPGNYHIKAAGISDNKYISTASAAVNVAVKTGRLFLRPLTGEAIAGISYRVSDLIDIGKANADGVSISAKLSGTPAVLIDGKLYDYTDGTVSFASQGSHDVQLSANGMSTAGFSYYELKDEPARFPAVIKVLQAAAGSITLAQTAVPFYYGANPVDNEGHADWSAYFAAKNGDSDVSRSRSLKLSFSRTAGGSFMDWGTFTKISNSTVPGTEIYVSANYAGAVQSVPLKVTVAKCPMYIFGTDAVSSDAHMPLQKTYSGAITIKMPDQADPLKMSSSTGCTLQSIWASVPAGINTSVITNIYPGKYRNIPMEVSINSVVSKYYELVSAVLDEYEILPAYVIGFCAAHDDTVLADSIIKEPGEVFEVSINSASDPVCWYCLASDGTKYELADKYVSDEKAYAEKTATAHVWRFHLGTAVSSDAVFYAVYGNAQTVDKSGYISAETILPVTYTGKPHVSEALKDSEKYSNDLAVTVYEKFADGSRKTLTEGIDYKINCKNNTDAAATTSGDRAPTAEIRGIGAHKDVRLAVKFTILPADLKTAEIAVKGGASCVKFSKKSGLAVTPVVTMNGKVLDNKYYTVRYFAADTLQQVADTEAYKSSKTAARFVMIAQAAGNNANYTGSSGFSDVFTGVPADSRKLAVSMKVSSIKYDSAKGITSVSAGSFTLKSVRLGNKSVSSSDYAVGLYTKDKNGYTIINSGSAADTGDYYIGVTPGAGIASYETVYKKVRFAGTRLKKNMFRLEHDKLGYTGASQADAISFAGTDFQDKGSVTFTYYDISGNSMKSYQGNAAVTGAAEDLQNAGAGRYTVAACGSGRYYGSVTYSYTVEEVKLSGGTKAGITVTVNDGKAVSFNAGGYDAEHVPVSVRYTINGTAVTLGSDDYEAVFAIPKKAGSNAGSVTVKGKSGSFTGKLTQKFDISAADLDSLYALEGRTFGNIDSVSMTCAVSAKKPPVKLMQYGAAGWKELKAGRDYTLKGYLAFFNEGTNTAEAVPAAAKGKGSATFSGSGVTVEFFAYSQKVSGLKVTLSGNGRTYEYTGYEVRPEVETVFSGRNDITSQVSWNAVYTNCTENGSRACAEVTLMPNDSRSYKYGGSIKLYYRVSRDYSIDKK